MPTKAQFQKIIKKIVRLGEDPREAKLWLNLFDTLPPQQQEKICRLYEEEARALEKLKEKK